MLDCVPAALLVAHACLSGRCVWLDINSKMILASALMSTSFLSDYAVLGIAWLASLQPTS